MRGAVRWTMACFAAGLWLAPATALAQEAATTNTPAAQSVGPSELQNFNLQGNVTRAAEQPVERAPAPATAAPRSERPAAAAAEGSQPPVRQRTEVAQTSRPRVPTEQILRRETEQRPAAPTVESADADRTGSLSRAVPAAAPAPTFTTPQLAAPPAPTSDRKLPLWPWLLAAVAAIAGGSLLFWRNRSRPALAGGPQVDEFRAPEAPPVRAPEAPPVRWLTPEPKPVPRPAPAPTPAPAPAPRADVPPPKSAGIVSTGLRPWVEIDMRPLRVAVTDTEVTFEFELELFNSGNAPARDILVEAVLVNAGENQVQDMAAFFARPPGSGERIPLIEPLKRTAFVSRVVVSREHVRIMDIGTRQAFVPLLAFNAYYRRSAGEAQTSLAYLVGPVSKGDKLAPFRTDLGPRMFEGLGARLLPEGVRR